MTDRTYTMRALVTLARERFGPKASELKTRDELERALGLVEAPAAQPAPQAGLAPLVVKDFFLPRR